MVSTDPPKSRQASEVEVKEKKKKTRTKMETVSQMYNVLVEQGGMQMYVLSRSNGQNEEMEYERNKRRNRLLRLAADDKIHGSKGLRQR